MDLSKLSDADLDALESGDLTKLSDAGLAVLESGSMTKEQPGQLASFGAGLGKGFGGVVLGAQNLVGMGLEKLGADEAGQWLQQDAQQGKAKLSGELAPYKAANPLTAGAGELTAEIGATLPVGGVLAKGVSMLPSAAKAAPLVQALRSGGASGGGIGTRIAGGAATGGAAASLIDPNDVGLGAGIGAALPVVGRGFSAVGNRLSPESLMQSALKPTIAQLKSGEAKTAIDTLLKYGINATGEGAERVKTMVGDVDKEILDAIAGSGARIPKQDVLNRLKDVEGRFTNQVNPTSDLAAIQNVGTDFANHPMLTGQDIPVDVAQRLKQGTYKILEKKYGQVGTAETEAQKGLARGLKEEIAKAVPAVGPLNKKQSDLIKTMKVVGRRSLMDENRNPVGIAGLSQSPLQLAAMLADRSALVKSLAARGINAATPEGKNALMVEMLRQGVYRGAPVGFAD
jgi:hypothetical protein